MEPLMVVEIQARSLQGRTRPFQCRGADGHLYFVKGRDAGQRSLICEWLGGHLAKAFGLPIPDFLIARAPRELLALHPEGKYLGDLPLFASRKIEQAQEFNLAQLPEVPNRLQRDVLMFDWWIHNADRTLSIRSGNPNLLWNVPSSALAVIDQNLAFERDFDDVTFCETHVFSGQIVPLGQDMFEPDRYRDKFARALEVWDEACKNVPPEWWFVDEEQTVSTDFDPDETFTLLSRYANTDFWRLI